VGGDREFGYIAKALKATAKTKETEG